MAVAELIPPNALEDVDAIDVPKGYELHDGELVEKPIVSNLAVWIANTMNRKLEAWNDAARDGTVLPPESEFACFPDQPRDVRKPDGAFVVGQFDNFVPTHGKYKFAPDLVIEVLSPSNTMMDMFDRISDFFSAGTKLLWLIDPDRRCVQVYRPDFSSTKVGEHDVLLAEDVLPGFTMTLAEVLPRKA